MCFVDCNIVVVAQVIRNVFLHESTLFHRVHNSLRILRRFFSRRCCGCGDIVVTIMFSTAELMLLVHECKWQQMLLSCITLTCWESKEVESESL